MNYFHKNLVQGEWQKLDLIEQLANLGAEIGRCAKWQGKDEKIFNNCVLRALELFELTIKDPKNKKRLKEICRAKELFLRAVYGDNEFNTNLKDLEKYFTPFMVAIRQQSTVNKQQATGN